MNRQRFLFVIIIILVITNLLMLGFIFFKNRPQTSMPLHFRMAAQHTMQLDDRQLQKFVESAENHRRAILNLNKQQQNLLQKYYLPLTDDNQISKTDSLEQAIYQIEKRKLEITYKHFEEVKNQLRPNQMAGYKQFMQKSLGRILGQQEKKK